MNLKEARKKLKELAGRSPVAGGPSNLSAYNFRPDRIVRVVHGDGSVMFFSHAFALTCEDWYFVLTEHNGYHLYNKEDCEVTGYRAAKIQSVENFEANRNL
jgi:hypothetical protein